MKVFIIKKDLKNQYAFTQVADSVVADYRSRYKDKIIVESSSIQSAFKRFAEMDKLPEPPFNLILRKS